MNKPGKPIAVPKSMMALRLISKLNVFLYRLSGGRIMGEMGGTPVCLVTMIGRRSGRSMTIPLMYNPHGDEVLLVASLGGSPKNPAWYYNVTANPHVEIQTGSRKRKMLARQVSSSEKAALWPEIVRNFPSYEAYQQNTNRDIPVIRCSPE